MRWLLGLLLAVTVAQPAAAAPFLERFYMGGASDPGEPVTGPDGAVWFDVRGGVGRVAADGTVTLRRTPGVRPRRLTVGPDGAFWFIDFSHQRVGRMEVHGAVTTFSLTRSGTNVFDIAAGPDGNLWVTDYGDITGERGRNGAIWRLTPAGLATELALPPRTYPTEIIAGADGNLWFVQQDGMGRITPGGDVRVFDLPGDVSPDSITVGPDGDIWVSDDWRNGVIRLSADGSQTLVRMGRLVSGLTSGPDGNLWFTARRYTVGLRAVGLNGVGRMSLDAALTAASVPGRLPRLDLWSEPFGIWVDGLAFDGAGQAWGTQAATHSLVRERPAQRAPAQCRGRWRSTWRRRIRRRAGRRRRPADGLPRRAGRTRAVAVAGAGWRRLVHARRPRRRAPVRGRAGAAVHPRVPAPVTAGCAGAGTARGTVVHRSGYWRGGASAGGRRRASVSPRARAAACVAEHHRRPRPPHVGHRPARCDRCDLDVGARSTIHARARSARAADRDLRGAGRQPVVHAVLPTPDRAHHPVRRCVVVAHTRAARLDRTRARRRAVVHDRL
jgi:streptogramin lyase